MNTICWQCKNACGRCSWSRSLDLVPGCIYRQGARIECGHDKLTYTILWCPQYCDDKWNAKEKAMRKKIWDEKRAIELMATGYTDLQVAEMVGASLSAIRCFKSRNREALKQDAETFPVVETDPKCIFPAPPPEEPKFAGLYANAIVSALAVIPEELMASTAVQGDLARCGRVVAKIVFDCNGNAVGAVIKLEEKNDATG